MNTTSTATASTFPRHDPNPGNVWGYDQARINLLNEYANHLWQDASDIYMVLEHWVDLSENQTWSTMDSWCGRM